MEPLHQCLVEEIKRQIRVLESDTNKNRGVKETKEYSGIIDVREQNFGDRYHNALRTLFWHLTSDIEIKPRFCPIDRDLLWKLPAFCGDATVVDQNYAKARSKALQDYRSAKHNYTADIWERRELAQWISGPESSILVVQGTSQSAERLEKFSVELVDYLEARFPTVFLLSPLPATFYENSISRGDDVLRQITVQCLRMVFSSSKNKNNILRFLDNDAQPFLAKTTSHFQTASHQDWFSSIEAALSYQEQVYIVMDISILRQHFSDAFSWPARFSDLVHKLRNQGTNLRVMILTGRSIDGHLGATTRVMSVDMAPQSPPHVHDLSKSKKPSLLLSQSDRPQILASLPASMNNTETTRKTFVRSSIPSDLINSNRKEDGQDLVEDGRRSGLGSFQAADSGVKYEIAYCCLSLTFLD